LAGLQAGDRVGWGRAAAGERQEWRADPGTAEERDDQQDGVEQHECTGDSGESAEPLRVLPGRAAVRHHRGRERFHKSRRLSSKGAFQTVLCKDFTIDHNDQTLRHRYASVALQ